MGLKREAKKKESDLFLSLYHIFVLSSFRFGRDLFSFLIYYFYNGFLNKLLVTKKNKKRRVQKKKARQREKTIPKFNYLLSLFSLQQTPKVFSSSSALSCIHTHTHIDKYISLHVLFISS